ncbi:AfsR/SARP family transcriptional regulator [Kitasatospora sp. NPDC052896]|uniref:AfsR/SARP family transcriptional regulator n=1 Tax=Kitasatospora sp. NPDC052896 TaxID=3364061 RepID=UPI0037CC82A0
MRFSLLGPLTVHDGTSARTLDGPKTRVLLGVLLLNPNQPVTNDHLQEALWGEHPPVTASASLKNHIARLRRALTEDSDDEPRIRSVPGGYVLHVGSGELDTDDFTSALATARTAYHRQDWLTVSQETKRAVSLWRGAPMPELANLTDAQPHVERYTQARWQALEWHIDAELALGHHQGLAPELTGLIAEQPLREAFHRQLMLVLHRTGQQAEALAVFSRLRHTLVDELGVEPGASVLAAHQEILQPTATPTPATPPHAPGHEQPGWDGSSDAAPDVAGPGQDSKAFADPSGTFPQQPTPPPAPAQLPADTPLFTGRQHELHQLCHALTDHAEPNRPHVVAVTGMGGIGKSALAVHAAHLLRDHFPDGQLHLDLHGFGTHSPRPPREALATLLADLHRPGHDTPVSALPEHTDDRATLLRTTLAGRRVLIVLDNARDSAQVLPLLPGTGRSTVIVTSRASLTDLPTSHHLPLAPMDIEEQRELLTALCGVERVQQDLEGALRLLTACAGLPLALRIVGARLTARPAWPPAALADLLGDDRQGRLARLTAGHLGVRATFDSSYCALTPEAARAFRLLGLWPGRSLGTKAAAALLQRPCAETTQLLEHLVDAHLLESPEPQRYRFHDLLAEYAAERARAEEPVAERQAAHLRLCVWYTLALQHARQAMRVTSQPQPWLDEEAPAPLPAFNDEKEAMDWCRLELADIGEAIRISGEGPRPDLAWRLAIWLFGYMRTNWWTGQWEEYLNQALRIAEQHDDRLGRAWLLRSLGSCHGFARRPDKSIEALEAALALFDDPASRVAVLSNLSLTYSDAGQANQALAHVREALELHGRTGGRSRPTAGLVSVLANALRATGQYTQAETHYREALELWREDGDTGRTSVILADLGDVLRCLGRRAQAVAALHEGLELAIGLGAVPLAADALIALARTHAHFAEWPAARARACEAVALAERHQLEVWCREAHDLLATIEQHTVPEPASTAQL